METNATLGLTVSCGLTVAFMLRADVGGDCVDSSDGEDGTMVRVLDDEILLLKVKLGNNILVVCFRSDDKNGVAVTADIFKTVIVGDGSSICVVPDILDTVVVILVLAWSKLLDKRADKSTLLLVGTMVLVGDKALLAKLVSKALLDDAEAVWLSEAV